MGFFSKFGDALIGAAGGLISGVTGNVIGKKSQDNTNETNLKIAQMNNEWSEKMLDKQERYNQLQWQREAEYNKQMVDYQNKWNLEQWNRENEYNSASSQAQRLRDAGINPYLAMNGGNAGSASSVSSASGSTPSGNSLGLPSPSGATMQSFRPDMTAIGNAITSFLDYKMRKEMNDAQVQNILIENQYKARQMMTEMMNKAADTHNKQASTRLMRQAFELQPTIVQADNNLKAKQAEAASAQAKLNLAESLLRDKTLSKFDERFQKEVALMAAQTLEAAARMNFTEAQAKHELQKELKTIAEAAGIKLNNNNLKEMSWSLIEEARNNAIRAGQPQNIWQGFSDAHAGFNKYVNDWLVKPTKKAIKDTRRSLGF